MSIPTLHITYLIQGHYIGDSQTNFIPITSSYFDIQLIPAPLEI